MIKRLLLGLAAGAALTLDQALRPAKVGEMRRAVSVVDEAEDGYEGTVRGTGGAFQPAAEIREDVWVHASATEGRDVKVILAEEQAARADVPVNELKTRLAWHATRDQMQLAGLLHYEGDGDMSDEAREAKYGPDWRALL